MNLYFVLGAVGLMIVVGVHEWRTLTSERDDSTGYL